MRFRLSTILLVAAIFCVLIAWYANDNAGRNDIVNVWHYPNVDAQGSGYWDTFTVNNDGTFTKLQSYRGHSELFKGTYKTYPNGVVQFYVESKDFDLHGRNKPETYPIGKSFRCRCAIDDTENLLVHQIDGELGTFGGSQPAECNIVWKCYSSTGAIEKHRKERLETFEAFFKQTKGDRNRQ